MFQQHFGLKYVPFSKNGNCLMSEEIIQLQTYFTQLLHTPGIGVLTGEPGVGKTMALRHLTKNINPHEYQVFYLPETQFTSFDIYRQIAILLGLTPHYRFAQLWRDIKTHIRERVENKRILPIFIIDEAQNLPLDFFRGFPSFINFDFDAWDRIIVWFVGHPSLNHILDRTAYCALTTRIQVRYALSPVFERERFGKLLEEAFKDAGCPTRLLSDSGTELLRVASSGNPRNVYRILLKSLQLAAQKGLNHLPDDLITESIQNLKR